MKARILLPLLTSGTLLLLTACSDQNETSVKLNASEAVAASDVPAAGQQTLTSSDGKIAIITANSRFADRLHEAEAWVGDNPGSQLILLQRDENSGITLSVSNLGAPKAKANVYFQQLAEQLQQHAGLNNLTVGAATENRMNYRFSHSQNEQELHEACVALYTPAHLYIVCASSTVATQQQLADTLKNISLKP